MNIEYGTNRSDQRRGRTERVVNQYATWRMISILAFWYLLVGLFRISRHWFLIQITIMKSNYISQANLENKNNNMNGGLIVALEEGHSTDHTSLSPGSVWPVDNIQWIETWVNWKKSSSALAVQVYQWVVNITTSGCFYVFCLSQKSIGCLKVRPGQHNDKFICPVNLEILGFAYTGPRLHAVLKHASSSSRTTNCLFMNNHYI